MSTYDLYKNKTYALRLPNELREKFEEIAKRQGYKKLSNAYKDVIENYVKAYEIQYGEIDLSARAEKQNKWSNRTGKNKNGPTKRGFLIAIKINIKKSIRKTRFFPRGLKKQVSMKQTLFFT